MIDTAQGGQNLGPIEFAIHRTSGPLEFTDRSIGIHRNHQRIAAAAGLLEIADMPRVQEVEASVGEDESFAGDGITRPEGFQFMGGHQSCHPPMGNLSHEG